MKQIPDHSVDMILCDPPYGTTACKWDKQLRINIYENKSKDIQK
jgi:site-specific DNA-methyltransferase (adenine-specific)